MPVFFLETSGVFDRFEFPCHMGSYLLSFRVDCRRTVLLHVQTMVSLPMLAIFIVQANDNTWLHTGAVRIPYESALKADPGRKILGCNGESNMHQQRIWPKAQPSELRPCPTAHWECIYWPRCFWCPRRWRSALDGQVWWRSRPQCWCSSPTATGTQWNENVKKKKGRENDGMACSSLGYVQAGWRSRLQCLCSSPSVTETQWNEKAETMMERPAVVQVKFRLGKKKENKKTTVLVQ